MILSIEDAKWILEDVYLEMTPYYSKERGLKFFAYPILPTRWNEVFVLLDGEKRIGLAIAENNRFEIYCSDEEAADAFIKNVPMNWDGYECIGKYRI